MRIPFEIHGVVVRELRALKRHNLYAYMPVLRILMDIGPYATRPSSEFSGFVERLTAWLPGIQQHECSVGRPGGFVERLRRGTYLAHICEHVCLELQNLMGFDVRFGKARNAGEPSLYRVVIAYQEEVPAVAAFETALRLTLAAMNDEPFDTPGEIEKLLSLADDYRLGPSTAAIVRAAERRNIPVIRLTPQGSLVQLGYGIYQKRIRASETSNTSAIAVDLCQEKPMTNRMLRAVGVPVPEGQTVLSADEAWQAAQDIGLPVVLKPETGNQGKGVSVNLCTEDEVRGGYDVASPFDRCVLVERYIQGEDFRLLVVNGEMVAATRREPAQVVGDGHQTVEQLVAKVNRDPRRRPGHSNPLTQIRLDEAAELVLGQQGLTRDSVPAAGRTVKLRTNANLSTGGTSTDVTDDVHPSNARLAELAAQILALDVAGIDVICRDIRRPLSEQEGAIVEVNAAPGLRMHLHPTSGRPRQVGKRIVEMLYPQGSPSRVAIISITGTNGKTTVTRLVAHMHKTARKTVGLACTDGVYIGERRIMSGDCSGPLSAEAVLLHPQVEVAVLETARGGILRQGLGYEGCDVGVVTNVSADHLGQSGIETVEDLARVKQVVIDAVLRKGCAVLNADDRLVAAMAADTDARVIYFSPNPNSQVLRSHVASGGSCVTVENGSIMLHGPHGKIDIIELSRVPFTFGGRIGFQVVNALAATAASLGAGLNPALISRALATFNSDVSMAPGRMNFMNVRGIDVLLDYAHNEAALNALGQAVATMSKRRNIMVIGLPGDRRDRELIGTFSAAIEFADAFVLHDLADRRGRKPDEVPLLLKGRLPANVPVEIAVDQKEAVRLAWKNIKPGDRLIVIADEVDDAIAALELVAGSDEGAACEFPLAPMELLEDRGRGSNTYAHRGW